jgi:hypothetical protein
MKHISTTRAEVLSESQYQRECTLKTLPVLPKRRECVHANGNVTKFFHCPPYISASICASESNDDGIPGIFGVSHPFMFLLDILYAEYFCCCSDGIIAISFLPL